MKKHQPSPNDQRSVVKNPQTAAYEADRQNRIALGHPDVPPPPPVKEVTGAPAPASPKKA